MSVKEKNIIVALTGGIACYKSPVLVRLLKKAGSSVRVIMTEGATKFITPLTLETVSENPVFIEMLPDHQYVATRHIDLAEWPDLLVVAPATANFLGKVASGISDDLLTTIVCATPKPVMIVPAMNPQMWSNPITQRNYRLLKEIGCHFVQPASGDMACNHRGVGRMPEPEQIFEEVRAFFARQNGKGKLNKKKILITAGPTREPLDPVRFISNHSSGRMGYALAGAAISMGAETTLISGPVRLAAPDRVNMVAVETTEQLANAVRKHARRNDCLIMAAAPADFIPAKVEKKKIKRSSSEFSLKLKPTDDILQSIGRWKRRPFLVGFALESDNGPANARKKLKEKNLDMIVLNQIGDKTGFNSDTNEVTIIMPHRKPQLWPLMTKTAISAKLLEILAPLL